MKNIESPIIVVKIGTNVLSLPNCKLDLNTIENIVEEINDLKEKNYKVILITSGAVGSGKAIFAKIGKKLCMSERVEEKQVFAAVGQVELMRIYSDMFSKYGIQIAQVLATKVDFSNREHYLNMRRCFSALLKNDVLPIVNENDTVSINELMFTDNDELAGYIATMLKAQKLILLTNVDGLFDGSPKDSKSKLISEVKLADNVNGYISAFKSEFGKGGMQTKLNIATKLAKLGITVHFTNGKNHGILKDVMSGKKVGTTFLPRAIKSNMKRFLGFSSNEASAEIIINENAEKLLKSDKVISLLPIGIIGMQGTFELGDIIKIVNSEGVEIGIGKAQYNSTDLEKVIGQKGQKEAVHYDYMFIK